MTNGEDVKKREPLNTVGEKVYWCSHYDKQDEVFTRQKELPYDPIIAFFYNLIFYSTWIASSGPIWETFL